MSVKSSRSMFIALRHLAGMRAPVTASEMARALDLPMTTTLRLLETLEAAQYAERVEAGNRYALGRAARTLAFAFMSQFPIRDIALPYLQRLTLETGQTSSLFVQLGWYAVRAAMLLGDGVPSQGLRVGEARSLLNGAPSLAIFAGLSPQEADAACSHTGAELPANTFSLLDQVRSRGFVIAPCPFEPSAFDLAYPLRDSEGTIMATVAFEAVPAGAIEALSDPQSPAHPIIAELAARAAAPATGPLSHYRHVPEADISL